MKLKQSVKRGPQDDRSSPRYGAEGGREIPVTQKSLSPGEQVRSWGRTVSAMLSALIIIREIWGAFCVTENHVKMYSKFAKNFWLIFSD